MKRLALLLICGVCGGVQASPDITFHGTLVSPPACTINEGQTIELEFRDVLIDSIDGNYARRGAVHHQM